MAQRRDAKGRFASGGGGGKLGKSAKNTKARAQYKKAAMEARVASRAQSNASKRGTANKFTASEAKRTKSNLTRVTNKLTARGAASKAAKPAKPAASRPAPKARTATASKKGKAAGGMKNQVAAGRKAKANYKAATSRAREAKMLTGGRTSTRGLGKRTDAGAKNIRSNVKAYQSAAAKVRRMESKRSTGATRRRNA